MLRAIAQAVERLDLRGRRVLVAVSGGIDSVALLHALHELAHEYALKLLIGHVNHGLRGAESEADQAAVEGYAQQVRNMGARVIRRFSAHGRPLEIEEAVIDAVRIGQLLEVPVNLVCQPLRSQCVNEHLANGHVAGVVQKQ